MEHMRRHLRRDEHAVAERLRGVRHHERVLLHSLKIAVVQGERGVVDGRR